MKTNFAAAAILLALTVQEASARFFYWPNYFYHYSASIDTAESPYSSTQQTSLSSTSFLTTLKTNVDIQNCGDESDKLHIRKIRITPEIVVPGGTLTIEATGTLDEDVEPGSEAQVDVKLGRIRLLRKNFDICDELEKNEDKVELQCPINKGDLSVTQEITLPKQIPKAKFIVDVDAYNQNGDNLACLRIAVDFRMHGP